MSKTKFSFLLNYISTPYCLKRSFHSSSVTCLRLYTRFVFVYNELKNSWNKSCSWLCSVNNPMSPLVCERKGPILNKNWSFLLRISSVNVIKSRNYVSKCDQILNGKLQFLCSVNPLIFGSPKSSCILKQTCKHVFSYSFNYALTIVNTRN